MSIDESFNAEVLELNKKMDAKKLNEQDAQKFVRKVLLPKAKKLGYDFTEKDLADFGNSQEFADLAKLSPQEMENVSGGMWSTLGNFANGVVRVVFTVFSLMGGSGDTASPDISTQLMRAEEARPVSELPAMRDMLDNINTRVGAIKGDAPLARPLNLRRTDLLRAEDAALHVTNDTSLEESKQRGVSVTAELELAMREYIAECQKLIDLIRQCQERTQGMHINSSSMQHDVDTISSQLIDAGRVMRMAERRLDVARARNRMMIAVSRNSLLYDRYSLAFDRVKRAEREVEFSRDRSELERAQVEFEQAWVELDQGHGELEQLKAELAALQKEDA